MELGSALSESPTKHIDTPIVLKPVHRNDDASGPRKHLQEYLAENASENSAQTICSSIPETILTHSP